MSATILDEYRAARERLTARRAEIDAAIDVLATERAEIDAILDSQAIAAPATKRPRGPGPGAVIP